MRVIKFICVLLLVLSLLILGIGAASDNLTSNVTEKTWYVGPEKVFCTGMAPQMCLQVKENISDNYSLFYDNIEGFCYSPGYEYVIRVTEEPVENPPADAASKKWTLVEVVSKTGNITASGLEGVNWRLDSYLSREGETACVLPDTQVNALFESGRVSGNAGCNSYGGQYMVDGNNLTISDVASTLMFCGENVSDQESSYLANLQSAKSYNISGNLLRIANFNGTVVLTYSVVQPASLTGTEWNMLSYNNGRGGLVSALADTKITALFSEEGELTGSAGCNSYSTSYEVNDSTIEIFPAAVTRMYCSIPEGIMEQESEYLAALQSAASYEIQGEELVLLDANNTRAVIYEAASG
jgi:heat shock protein HslJ